MAPLGCADGAPPDRSLTTRAELGGTELTVSTRLLQRSDWGRALVVTTAGARLQVVLGLETERALIGAVDLAGAWRELADPLSHTAISTVFGEATRLRLDSSLDPGLRRGVQLNLAPALAVAGFGPGTAAGTEGGQPSARTLGLVTALTPHPALGLEAYAALRTDAPPEVEEGWELERVPFPGGPLLLVGARLALSGTPGDLWASANVSAGPELPPAAHLRLVVRGDHPFGEAAAMVAAASREFRSLDGVTTVAPLVWAVRLRGAVGPPGWQVKYRAGARGEELAQGLRPAAGGQGLAQREVTFAVAPAVALGGWTVTGESELKVSEEGTALGFGARLYGAPGMLSVGWHGGAGDGGELRVRGAARAAPVVLKAAVIATASATTAELGLELRRPGFKLRLGLEELGKAPPAGPVVSVTVSVDT